MRVGPTALVSLLLVGGALAGCVQAPEGMQRIEWEVGDSWTWRVHDAAGDQVLLRQELLMELDWNGTQAFLTAMERSGNVEMSPRVWEYTSKLPLTVPSRQTVAHLDLPRTVEGSGEVPCPAPQPWLDAFPDPTNAGPLFDLPLDVGHARTAEGREAAADLSPGESGRWASVTVMRHWWVATQEVVSTPAGTFETYRIEARIWEEGIFGNPPPGVDDQVAQRGMDEASVREAPPWGTFWWAPEVENVVKWQVARGHMDQPGTFNSPPHPSWKPIGSRTGIEGVLVQHQRGAPALDQQTAYERLKMLCVKWVEIPYATSAGGVGADPCDTSMGRLDAPEQSVLVGDTLIWRVIDQQPGSEVPWTLRQSNGSAVAEGTTNDTMPITWTPHEMGVYDLEVHVAPACGIAHRGTAYVDLGVRVESSCPPEGGLVGNGSCALARIAVVPPAAIVARGMVTKLAQVGSSWLEVQGPDAHERQEVPGSQALSLTLRDVAAGNWSARIGHDAGGRTAVLDLVAFSGRTAEDAARRAQ